MAEENGVEDLNGKTEELALENGECDEDEKGILFKKPLILFCARDCDGRVYFTDIADGTVLDRNEQLQLMISLCNIRIPFLFTCISSLIYKYNSLEFYT